jgi:hypothetical protein
VFPFQRAVAESSVGGFPRLEGNHQLEGDQLVAFLRMRNSPLEPVTESHFVLLVLFFVKSGKNRLLKRNRNIRLASKIQSCFAHAQLKFLRLLNNYFLSFLKSKWLLQSLLLPVKMNFQTFFFTHVRCVNNRKLTFVKSASQSKLKFTRKDKKNS